MLAARITLPHFSISSAMCLPNSAGELGNPELLKDTRNDNRYDFDVRGMIV